MSPFVLELSAISKSYPTPAGELVIVDNLSLKVKEGEFVSIMGHSGCGKSTVLAMVAGLSQPTQGAVILDGREGGNPGPERMVVFQNYSLLPWMTVKENVLFAVESARATRTNIKLFGDKTPAERLLRAEKYLELVGLGHAMDKLPAEISGGMKQRVSIARALALQPRVLIMDEPFGALDAITREEMQDEMLAIWSHSNTTGLMVTHEIDEAILLSDRIVMMTNGPNATIGAIFDVPFARPRSREQLFESPGYYTLRNEIVHFLYEKFAHSDVAESAA